MQASTLAGLTDFTTGYGCHSLCYEKQSLEKGFYELFKRDEQ